ncbi:MAG: endonuclease/exonuclease/phosphatase family protein [Planctomycetota bacterium]
MRWLLFLLLVAVGCSKPITRFAQYNASLYRSAPGELVADLSTPDDEQAQAVAAVIQEIRPDVLLINEFDWDAAGKAADLFRTNYLQVSQGGREPINYPHVYVAESNTGIPSGHDLNNDGQVGGDLGTRAYGNDALGYGTFPGQYSFILLSKHPIDHAGVRTFREVLWAEKAPTTFRDATTMPADLTPAQIRNADGFVGPPPGWFTADELAIVRLSSKSHVRIRVDVGKNGVDVLLSHPTPPGFDGPEDRNGRRNHDEIALLAERANDFSSGAYPFIDYTPIVVMGDLNADPADGGSIPGAIEQLLERPNLQDPRPRSGGGVAAALRQGGVNPGHAGDPALDTGDFSDTRVGNLRVDYVLPSERLEIVGSGVYWPRSGPGLELVEKASDHRLVWVDVVVE